MGGEHKKNQSLVTSVRWAVAAGVISIFVSIFLIFFGFLSWGKSGEVYQIFIKIAMWPLVLIQHITGNVFKGMRAAVFISAFCWSIVVFLIHRFFILINNYMKNI